jgi:hypothetical protein
MMSCGETYGLLCGKLRTVLGAGFLLRREALFMLFGVKAAVEICFF